MVVVANFAPGPFPAFLREHVLLLIHEVHKQQSNTAWGRWGGCHGCINNAPKWGLVCKILHTKPILGVFENRLVCKILHTNPWGANRPSPQFRLKYDQYCHTPAIALGPVHVFLKLKLQKSEVQSC